MKIRKTICSLLLVCLAFLGIFCGRANVYADQKQALSATVTLLKQEKDCVVQVEAKNSGADFTGKVRLVFSGTDNSNGCAFEQCLTLPQNGKKQYTMTIPYADVSQTRGNGIVAFIDEKGNVVAKEAFASIFGKEKRGIGVGVLSDHYDALGIIFIGVVFIGGRNLKLHETRVYSVTAQQADGKSTTGIATYYNAYHSGVKPWKVRLNDNYAYGGTGLSESYSMASSGRVYEDRYHYLVEYDRGLSLGVKPQSNFENAYLFAAGTAKGCGSIDTSGLVLTQQKQGGNITNNTSYDFPYLVCVSDDTVMVFSDVKAGETITIDGKSKKPLLSQQISYFDDVYSVLSQDNMNGNTYSYKHKDMAAALYLGLCQIRRQNDVSGTVVVEGVTADYGKTIESRCSEISFGCLYTIAGQEVSNASN